MKSRKKLFLCSGFSTFAEGISHTLEKNRVQCDVKNMYNGLFHDFSDCSLFVLTVMLKWFSFRDIRK